LLDKDGNIKDLWIYKSSGIEEADLAVIKSARDGAPYKSFTEEFNREDLPVVVTFHYNKFNGSYSPVPFAKGYNKPKSKYIL